MSTIDVGAGPRVPAPTAGRAPRADLATFTLHWLLVAALLVSLATGLRIAIDDTGGAGRVAVPGWAAAWLPEGAVIEWHVLSSWALVFVLVAYPLFLARARAARRVTVDAESLRMVRTAAARGKLWRSRPAWDALSRALYWVAFLLVAVMAVTGALLFAENTLVPARALQLVHGWAAYAFLAYIAIHILAQAKAGAFWKIFRPSLAAAGSAAVALGAAAAAVATGYGIERSLHPTLALPRMDAQPVLDGVADEAIWRDLGAVEIATKRAANVPDGDVPVTVRAYHDGREAHFLFSWPDAQRSQKHTPLIKTAEGWKILQNGLDANDEQSFYEDKFAVALSRQPDLASGTTHLGSRPLGGTYPAATRGLHYSVDGSLVDMWHWKSVRTNAMSADGTQGFMDDDHFGPPVEPTAGKRYTGGYQQDPHTGGGYIQNWKKLPPGIKLAGAVVTPQRLPADPSVLKRHDAAALAPTAQDEGAWFMLEADTVPYSPELDNFLVGTVMPSVVIQGPFQGDRADVRAKGAWKDGRWHLEVSRRLDTGSAKDVAIRPGEDIYLWVSVFNHAQTRHSQHLRPIRIRLD